MEEVRRLTAADLGVCATGLPPEARTEYGGPTAAGGRAAGLRRALPSEAERAALWAIDQNSDAWHAARALGFGASSVGAMMGWSPYTTSKMVWELNTGVVDRPADRADPLYVIQDVGIPRRFPVDHGHYMEDAAGRAYRALTGAQTRNVGIEVHPTVAWVQCSPDLVVDDYGDNSRLRAWLTDAEIAAEGASSPQRAEIKTPIHATYKPRRANPPDGAWDIPIHYLLQMQYQMLVGGPTVHFVDFVVMWQVNEDHPVDAAAMDRDGEALVWEIFVVRVHRHAGLLREMLRRMTVWRNNLMAAALPKDHLRHRDHHPAYYEWKRVRPLGEQPPSDCWPEWRRLELFDAARDGPLRIRPLGRVRGWQSAERPAPSPCLFRIDRTETESWRAVGEVEFASLAALEQRSASSR